MESPEAAFLKKIRLKMGKKLNTLFMGEYHSAFKGFGLDFDTVREYQYGDDIKNIDWNVTARMNHLYVKEYIEERELSVVFMIDVSKSLRFGSEKTKWDLMLEFVSVFLYLAQMNNDRVSVLLFTDKTELFMTPGKGRKFILKVLNDIVTCRPEGKGTDIAGALDFVGKVLKKRSVVFVISDFLDERSDEYALKMRFLGKKHDVIPVHLYDPMEKSIPFWGLTEFTDLETGETFLSDIVPGKGNITSLAGFDSISLNTVELIEIPILRYFERRNRTRLVT